MVLLLFVKCSCTNKVFFTEEKCDLLNFGGTFVHTLLFCHFLKSVILKNAPILNATSAYKYEEKNIYRTFDVVDKADYDMYYN